MITTIIQHSVTPNCPTFVTRIPVLYSFQLANQNAVLDAMYSMKTSSYQSWPASQICMTKNETEKASQPWSKSCPRGELDFVLLACLPSIASRVEQVHTQKAEQKNTQEGISCLNVKSQQRMIMVEESTKSQPMKVMRLGATHSGTRLTMKFQQGWRALSNQVYFPDLYWQKSRCLSPY